MEIKYRSENFNPTDYPNLLPNWQVLQLTKWELIAAAFTVGRSNRWKVFSHGQYSLYEMMYRSAMVLANLKKSSSDKVVQTSAYKALDPSEKSAVSYFFGLTICKLFADKLMSIPYLMHLEIYENEITSKYCPIIYRGGKSRPDLIGFDTSLNPYVFEAKGRSGYFDQKAFTKAKKQAQMLTSIGNPAITPKVAVAFQIFFNSCEELMVKWEDPEPDSNGLEYDFISAEDVLKKYYAPFFNLLTSNDFYISYKGFKSVTLPMLDMILHIPSDIELLFEEKDINNETAYSVIKGLMNIDSKELIASIKEKNNLSSINNLLPEGFAILGDKIVFEFGKTWNDRFL